MCDLTDFLANGKRSIDEICKYLILHTFNKFKPQAIYLGQLESDGNLVLKSSFGFDPQYISQWERIPLFIDIPINNAIRNDEVYVFLNQEDFFARYPAAESLGTVSRDWVSCFAGPVQSLGSFLVVLNGNIETCLEFDHFVRAVGNLLALHIMDQVPVHELVSMKSSLHSTQRRLTPRQELIRDLLVKGFTNPQIAAEIGYSESLVRQETIAIYSTLRVSGRKELIKMMEGATVTKV